MFFFLLLGLIENVTHFGKMFLTEIQYKDTGSVGGAVAGLTTTCKTGTFFFSCPLGNKYANYQQNLLSKLHFIEKYVTSG